VLAVFDAGVAGAAARAESGTTPIPGDDSEMPALVPCVP
jgi:hypothetical protein